MKTYKGIGDFLLKPILYAGLTIALSGCPDGNSSTPKQPTPKSEPKEFYFDSWGEVANLPGSRSSRTEVRTADLDGDDDLDIIITSSYGQVIIYENRIPQKAE